jgi:PHD/YefM family antitoxin component YafN of YafNO toxin-antitoxin module
MLDTRDVHSLTDFLRNHKVHMARIRDTKTAEVLTVHGRPELVLLSAESYQHLLDRLQCVEAISAIRADFAHAREASPPTKAIPEDEIERRGNVVRALMAETERLGLYK